MKKQTAVDWLVEQILTEVQDYEYGYIETESEPFKHKYVNKYIGMVDLSEFVNKAKAMEKEQKCKFADDYADQVMSGMMKRASEYYNETFKSE